ncbi:hypothetical protein pmac_cds_670 [Pandoravirus macleodensis]|uniref:Uncharacterized protein n=1 Tax=Pandoravirus macleodensis TaxID=2107707 RepID=A0A2U7UFT5_9VIRU|nr:hypothetical protein pmac_cds_670 [Pandoravirus macleodensis]AVK77358.1 hypothetical protein pmac_cds_670 [Pandoravirus macleodensis]
MHSNNHGCDDASTTISCDRGHHDMIGRVDETDVDTAANTASDSSLSHRVDITTSNVGNINDMLPNEILWMIFMFVGEGRMPCVPLMVCQRWRAIGGHRAVWHLLPVEIVDRLHTDLDVASLVMRAAALMCLVGHPPRHTDAPGAPTRDDMSAPTALGYVCAALGSAGRWQHIIALVERAPRALDAWGHWGLVASGAIVSLRADDALGRLTVTNARLSALCTALCCALVAGHAPATGALCARLANCGRARDSRYTARVDAATTMAAQRGHVDAVLAQDFCTAHNVALLWDAVVGARDHSAFAKLVRAVRRVGPEAMNAARHASWSSRHTSSAAQANLGALALGWYGGGWARAAAAAGWHVPFDMAMCDDNDNTDGRIGGNTRESVGDDHTGDTGGHEPTTTTTKNDMALAAHHPFRRSLSSLWSEAAAVAARHGHHTLAMRLTSAATASATLS